MPHCLVQTCRVGAAPNKEVIVRSMNQIVLLGRVGAEPEHRASSHSEREIIRFPLATHRNVKVGDGWDAPQTGTGSCL